MITDFCYFNWLTNTVFFVYNCLCANAFELFTFQFTRCQIWPMSGRATQRWRVEKRLESKNISNLLVLLLGSHRNQSHHSSQNDQPFLFRYVRSFTLSDNHAFSTVLSVCVWREQKFSEQSKHLTIPGAHDYFIDHSPPSSAIQMHRVRSKSIFR